MVKNVLLMEGEKTRIKSMVGTRALDVKMFRTR